MNVHCLFDFVEDANLNEYLKLKGISNPKSFINGKKPSRDVDSFDEKKIDKAQHMIGNAKKIVVLVDADVDGFTSASIMCRHLMRFGYDCDYILHKGKAHGVKKIMGCIPNDCLLIVPDASVDDCFIEELDSKNVATITVDHHEDSIGLIDNDDHMLFNNEDTPQSGALYVWKFCNELGANGNDLDLAILGNTADAMRQNFDETRYYNAIVKPHHKFIKALCEYFDCGLSPKDIGWKIAPMINSVIRSNDMELKESVFHAMVTEEFDDNLIKELDNARNRQRSEVKRVFEALEYDNSHNVVVINQKFDSDINGIAGLIAGRIESKEGKPAFVGSEDDGFICGSCRSPFGVKDFCNNTGLFRKAQGHGGAFGFDLLAENVEAFYKLADETLDDCSDEKEVLFSTVPRNICGKVFSEFNHEELWGNSLEEPLIHFRPFKVNMEDWKPINRYKTNWSFIVDGYRGMRFGFNLEFISKVKREEWGLGEKGFKRMEMIATPKIVNNRRIMLVKDIVFTDIEEEDLL